MRRESTRMTHYARSGGCGAKLGLADLRAALGCFRERGVDGRVLVDMSTSDDAGVVRVERGRALVHTIDVITPPVDDPRAFGRIAAANSLSDIYAMGGEPISAVALLGVPPELPRGTLGTILAASRVALRRAGAPLVGGHTVKDSELKLGFAVAGFVDPRRMTSNARARSGDRLVLSKPLGAGVLVEAHRRGLGAPRATSRLVRHMSRLNRFARDRMLAHGVRCATDVTGFGLIGHALNIARASGVDVILDARRLPALPEAIEHLDQGTFPAIIDANLAAYGRAFARSPGVPEALVRLAAGPETSGGLLMAAPWRRAGRLADEVSGWEIGEVRSKRGRTATVRLVG